MKLPCSLRAIGITLLAVVVAVAFADNVRQVKKKPTYRGWSKMTESRYGPTVRDGEATRETRAWNSRQRVGRMSPPLDSFVKRQWSSRPPVGFLQAKRDWEFLLSPEEISDALDEAKIIGEMPLNEDDTNDVLRGIIDFVNHEGNTK